MKYSLVAKVDSTFRKRALLIGRINCIEYHLTAVKTDYDKPTVLLELKKLKSWVSRLDNNHAIRTPNYYKLIGRTSDHITKLFKCYFPKLKNKEPETPEEHWIHQHLKKLHKQTHKARASEINYKIKSELQIANQNNEFVIFNTLTVRDGLLEQVFKPKSKFWDTYLTNWDRHTTGHRYSAVVERGEKTGRLHIHVLHIFKSINPKYLQDPNAWRKTPDYRELTGLKSFWKAGTSVPIMVRFHPNDAFGRLRFRWPVKKLDNGIYQPIEVKPPEALASYLSKYVLKAYATEGTEQWRTRLSRQFGKLLLKTILVNLTTQLLGKIMREPNILKTINQNENHNPPKLMIEIMATEIMIKRMRNRHPMMVTNLLTSLKQRPSIVEQLKDLTQIEKTSNLLNAGLSKVHLSTATISEIAFVLQSTYDYVFFNQFTPLAKGASNRT